MTSLGTILYYGGFALPDGNAAANRVMANGKILTQLGWHVIYLGHSGKVSSLQPLNGHPDMFQEPKPFSIIQWIKKTACFNHLQELMKSVQDLKMIILYNVPFATLLRVRNICRSQSIKVAYDCTEWTAETEGPLLKQWVKRLDCFAIRHWLPCAADALLVISHLMETTYSKHPHLLRLPPLIDIDNSIWHQPRKPHPDTFEFFYAGVLDGDKDRLDTIVSVFHTLPFPQARLRIIGVTKDSFLSFYPQFQSLSAVNDNRILFMGRCPHEDTVQFLLNCNCCIFIRPSDLRNNAGFPTKFVEAFTCGTPIITTDISDLRQYANENVHLLSGTDISSLAQAMTAAIETVSPSLPLNDTFHYVHYIQAMRAWLGSIL